MAYSSTLKLPAELAAELEQRYFWWQPVTRQRSDARILAQAMEYAQFADIRRIEDIVGRDHLIELMRHAEPGWLSDRSWEFWRGRLSAATGQDIAEAPPRRGFHAEAF